MCAEHGAEMRRHVANCKHCRDNLKRGVMTTVIIVGVSMAVLDLVITLFGRPLIKPDPLAKSMYPGLDTDERYGRIV